MVLSLLNDRMNVSRIWIGLSYFFATSTLQCPVYALWCHFALGPSYFKVLFKLRHAEPFVLCIDCSPEMHDELMPRVLAVLSAQAYRTQIVVQELFCLSDCAVVGNSCRHALLSQVLVTHVHYIMLCASESWSRYLSWDLNGISIHIYGISIHILSVQMRSTACRQYVNPQHLVALAWVVIHSFNLANSFSSVAPGNSAHIWRDTVSSHSALLRNFPSITRSNSAHHHYDMLAQVNSRSSAKVCSNIKFWDTSVLRALKK